MTSKLDKAKKLVEDDMIFIASENDKIYLFVCKGQSGRVYELIYHKELQRYKCECNNVRNNKCYHIVAAHYLRTGIWV